MYYGVMGIPAVLGSCRNKQSTGNLLLKAGVTSVTIASDNYRK